MTAVVAERMDCGDFGPAVSSDLQLFGVFVLLPFLPLLASMNSIRLQPAIHLGQVENFLNGEAGGWPTI